MKYILIAFKSRNSLYSFANKLKNYNVHTQVINTPSGISRSCSLSIRTGLENSNIVRDVLSLSHYNDLIGVFAVEIWGFNQRIKRLY